MFHISTEFLVQLITSVSFANFTLILMQTNGNIDLFEKVQTEKKQQQQNLPTTKLFLLLSFKLQLVLGTRFFYFHFKLD